MDLSFVFGDSRMEGMQTHIDAHANGVPIYVRKYSGKGLYDITTEIIKCLDTYPKAKIIVAGGIWDCTHRENKHDKFKFVFKSVVEMSSHVVALFKDSHRRIAEINPAAHVSYCQLIGMDMFRSKYTTDPEHDEQDILNAAIMSINNEIVALNVKNHAPTPWLAKRVHIPRKNGVHHQYCQLSDGIHWSTELKGDCAEKIVKAIINMQ